MFNRTVNHYASSLLLSSLISDSKSDLLFFGGKSENGSTGNVEKRILYCSSVMGWSRDSTNVQLLDEDVGGYEQG